MDMFRVLSYYGVWRGSFDDYLRRPVREVWADYEYLREQKKAEKKANS